MFRFDPWSLHKLLEYPTKGTDPTSFVKASRWPHQAIQYNREMIEGRATAEGTLAYANRFPESQDQGFYRNANSWQISSLGLGSYLGDLDDATDVAYFGAVVEAFRGGINHFDAAINYRHERSERALGSALRMLIRDNEAKREEFLVCTKAGFLTPGAIPEFPIPEDEVVRGVHCINSEFLKHQVERSRENFGFSCLDVFYLHNPETQLASVDRGVFLDRMRRAMETLEWCVSKGWIQAYGTATWDGYRRRNSGDLGLQLSELLGLANDVGGDHHHFRFVQLPFNLGMVEAYSIANQRNNENRDTRSILDLANETGVSVIASASILQSRLAQGLPEQTKTIFADAETDAQRAIQFARSAPGIRSALVGMRRRDHVAENLGVARFPPMPENLYRKLF